jgi:hypothetical protein
LRFSLLLENVSSEIGNRSIYFGSGSPSQALDLENCITQNKRTPLNTANQCSPDSTTSFPQFGHTYRLRTVLSILIRRMMLEHSGQRMASRAGSTLRSCINFLMTMRRNVLAGLNEIYVAVRQVLTMHFPTNNEHMMLSVRAPT